MRVIVDLDGTLANIDHRTHLVKGEKKDFDAFFKACVYDKPNKWCVEIIQALSKMGHHITIVSARSRVVEAETSNWLVSSLGSLPVQMILLRGKEDYTPDVELKRQWLKGQNKDEILFAIDDRQRVVDMWREEGLICLQCSDWENKEKK